MSAEYKEKADRILAELIDELVYEERQRILVEERMGLRVQELESLSSDLVLCLGQMCDYARILEESVVRPAVEVLPPSSGVMDEVSAQRDATRRRLDAVGMGQATPGSLAGMPDTAPFELSEGGPSGRSSDNAGAASSSPAVDTRDSEAAAALLRALASKKTALLDPLSDVHNILLKCARRSQALLTNLQTPPRERERPSSTSPSGDAAGSSPVREMSALREQLQTLQNTIERRGTASAVAVKDDASTLAGSRLAEVQAQLEEAERRSAARVQAYEMTVQSLNSEVTDLQEKLAATRRQCEKELEEQRRERDRMTVTHDGQLAECDAALSRVALELEQLIRENAQLKQQLRTVCSSGA